jgi:hypothetical protein
MNTTTRYSKRIIERYKYNAIFIALPFKTVNNIFRFNENERDNKLLFDFEYSGAGENV